MDIRLMNRFPGDPSDRPVLACTSSGSMTGPGVVLDKPGVLAGFTVTTNGVDDAEVIVYDNASGPSGKVLAHVKVAGGDLLGGLLVPVRALKGIYLSMSGNPSVVAYYHA